MIKHLQDDFIHHFELTGRNYQVYFSILNGHCILHDPYSCNPCIAKGKQQCDESSFKQIFILDTKDDVYCVNIEEFFNQFVGTKADSKSKCDLMLYGGTKVSFLDMYCGQEKFVFPYDTTHKDGRVEHKTGKIATVRKQITSTINKLCEVPIIEQALQLFNDKEGIFAYRNKTFHKDDSSQEESDESSITIFLRAAEAASSDLHTLLSHGFVFKTVLYPEVYIW